MSAEQSAAVSPAALLLLLRQTRSLLACHCALGLSTYPAVPELRQFGAERQATAPSPPRPQSAAVIRPAQESAPAAESLPELFRQLASCRRCAAAAPIAPSTSSQPPKLLVLVSAVFGPAEEELFWKMMAAIQLDRDSVYLTSTVKCKGLDMLPASRSSCFFWLEQELLAIQPRLICAMGEPAAWLLIGKNSPMLRLRGKLHPCCLSAAPQAQVLATYHPAFLLQQPKVKQAAWADLQLLQQRLTSF
ncbi:uracil-DNA glycosylase [Candidatus Electronema sp. JM]|uniref:uracil-DNA glycosylase n=1 Tax=Candidatus Electronema sp. JM TaxID=3401571 RepID=UPI003AA887FF